MTKFRISLISATALVALAPAAAWAQAQPSDQIEDIIVTAQKVSQSLQDVPVAVTAVTGEDLSRTQNKTVEDIAVKTPGVSFSRAGGQSFIYLRGIGSDTQGIGSDASVGLSLDGVYVSRLEFGATQFFDLDRVEVLRGPQGTLYGRNATGGVINILSKAPTTDTEAFVRAAYGTFDRIDLEGAVGTGISENTAIRLSGRFTRDDGFTKDLDPRGTNKIDDQDIYALRGQIQSELGGIGTARLIVDHTRFKSGNTSIYPLDDLGRAEALGAIPTEFGQTRNDLDTYDNWKTTGVTALVDLDVAPRLTLSMVTGFRHYDQKSEFNTDGTEIDVTRTQFERNYKQMSSELRLAYASDALRLVGGVFYMYEDKAGTLGLVRNAGLASPATFLFPSVNKGEALAGFVDGTLFLTPQFSVIAGIRYSTESKRDRTNAANVPDLLGIDSPLTPTITGRRNSYNKYSAWTPRFGLEFRPNEDVLLYATASRGFKSGGVNSYDVNAAFDPEFIWSYEGGVKAELLDRRLRLNATAFHYDYTDLQVSTFLNGFTFISNAASAKIDGVEVEALARVAPGLDIGGSVAWLDARYKDFETPFGLLPPAVPGGPRAPNLVDVSGNRLRNAPEWKASGSISYEGNLSSDLLLRMSAEANYQSRVFFSPFNENVVSNRPMTLINARIGIATGDDRWELAVIGKNLTDKDYVSNVVRFTSTSIPSRDPQNIGNALGYPQPGRSVAVQVSFKY
jgi:iron complex outermembrane receptor protein